MRLIGWALILAFAILGLSLLGIYLWHGCWYDVLTAEQKANFWTNYGVGFGTLALAIMTVASILETQGVIKAEDKRFMQSRVPAVVVTATDPAYPFRVQPHGRIEMIFENVGDGPAIDATITLDLRLRFLRPGTGPNTEEFADELITRTNAVLFSYLASKEKRIIHFPFSRQLRTDEGEYALPKVERLEIKFKDTFGNSYTIRYPDLMKNPQEFEREVPDAVQTRVS